MATTIIDPELSAGLELHVVQGSVADWILQVMERDGTFPVFDALDTVSARLYQGQTQAELALLPTSWAGGGAGFATGSVQVSPTSLQTMMLEPDGEYQLQVWWTSADLSRTACVKRAAVIALAAPGTTPQAVVPYCVLADLLTYAPWIAQVQQRDIDGEGFYTQRLKAREWLDSAILAGYRGAAVGNFEFHSTTAFAFGGGTGWRRSQGPSPSMVTWLASDFLMLKPRIVEATAYKAVSMIGLAQVGSNNQQAEYGCYFREMADRTLTGTVAAIDFNADGVGEIFVPLSSTNTLFT